MVHLVPSSNYTIVALIFHSATLFGDCRQKPQVRSGQISPCSCEQQSICVNCSKTRSESSPMPERYHKINMWLLQGQVGEPCNEIQPMRADTPPAVICSSSLNPVLSCIYLYGGGLNKYIYICIVPIRIHWHTHKLFSICNRVNPAEPKCTYISHPISFLHPPCFFHCKSAHKQLGLLVSCVTHDKVWFGDQTNRNNLKKIPDYKTESCEVWTVQQSGNFEIHGVWTGHYSTLLIN